MYYLIPKLRTWIKDKVKGLTDKQIDKIVKLIYDKYENGEEVIKFGNDTHTTENTEIYYVLPPRLCIAKNDNSESLKQAEKQGYLFKNKDEAWKFQEELLQEYSNKIQKYKRGNHARK